MWIQISVIVNRKLFCFSTLLLFINITVSDHSEKWIQMDVVDHMQEFVRTAVAEESRLWPNGIIYYEIADEMKIIEPLIQESMGLIESKTCVQFLEWDQQHPDYISIEKGQKCESYLGRKGGKQILSLTENCHKTGYILHELMHSLGFWHEMNRSDRDEYIKIHWDRIEYGQDFNFYKLHPWEYNHLETQFDYDSIMLYGPMIYSMYPGLPTITPTVEGVVLKDIEDKTLSDIDITRINRLYECFGEKRPTVPDPSEYICTFETDNCNIDQDPNNVAVWKRVKGERGTITGDHTTGDGYYLMLDAKEAGGKEAIFALPHFERNGRSEGCLSLYYHFRGPGTKTFVGMKLTSAGSSIAFAKRQAPAGKWRKATIDVDLNITNLRLFLVAVTVPTDESGGIFAVDDIKFQWKPCRQTDS